MQIINYLFIKKCVHKTINQDNTTAFYLTTFAVVLMRWDCKNVSPYIDIVLIIYFSNSEASSTIRMLQRALVSVIIALLNDSERSLNKKWLRPETNKIKFPHWLEIKAKHYPTFSLNCSISYIYTKKHTSSSRKSNLKILGA